MNVHMGRLDGVTATKQMKALIPHILVIGVTAFPNPLVHEAMLRAGAYTTIGKERLDKELLPTIELALNRAIATTDRSRDDQPSRTSSVRL